MTREQTGTQPNRAPPNGHPAPGSAEPAPAVARRIAIRGATQGVGFRPFVYRAAARWRLAGWVVNGPGGVEAHVEGALHAIESFLDEIRRDAPPAAVIAQIAVDEAELEGCGEFQILASQCEGAPTTRISPDLAICDDCLRELRDPADRRHGYPYINCANCGPRYTIVRALPYDRAHTTLAGWPLCAECRAEYESPLDRRYHAQPVACHACGPGYRLFDAAGAEIAESAPGGPIRRVVELLRSGAIVAIKGVGGYHLAADARNPAAVGRLRERKYRKEKAFAVMVPDLEEARRWARLEEPHERLLLGPARPIVLADARDRLEGVAPDSDSLGLMLPYAPLHHLLFDAGCPSPLVLTSGNRSSEPIAYRDASARERLAGIADALLIGERPIARRVDDSVAAVRLGAPMMIRRARGYAPAVVCRLPAERPILALGGDSKNCVTLVVAGQAIVSQHIGDLDDIDTEQAFHETVADLLAMYDLSPADVLVAHDLHPQFRSTRFALEPIREPRLRAGQSDVDSQTPCGPDRPRRFSDRLWEIPAERRFAVQHHRAHVASVLAEHELWDEPVIGVALDAVGYGDDGTIWGGEFFVGSVAAGFERCAAFRPARMAGGDAAARFPVQAAAGFLAEQTDLPDMRQPPFGFPRRYVRAMELVGKNVRSFVCSSAGRLFEAVAALLGFTREATFEGQAAMWLEHQARQRPPQAPYPFPDLDHRPLIRAIVRDRLRGRDPAEIASAFHAAVAAGVVETICRLSAERGLATTALSGGVFQNQLLLEAIAGRFVQGSGPRLLVNRQIPPNDGGISLGQAALAAMATRGSHGSA